MSTHDPSALWGTFAEEVPIPRSAGTLTMCCTVPLGLRSHGGRPSCRAWRRERGRCSVP